MVFLELNVFFLVYLHQCLFRQSKDLPMHMQFGNLILMGRLTLYVTATVLVIAFGENTIISKLPLVIAGAEKLIVPLV